MVRVIGLEQPEATPSSSSVEEPSDEASKAELPSSDIAPLESYRDRFRWPN